MKHRLHQPPVGLMEYLNLEVHCTGIAMIISLNPIQPDYFHHLLVWNTSSQTDLLHIIHVVGRALPCYCRGDRLWIGIQFKGEWFLQLYFCNLLGNLHPQLYWNDHSRSQQWLVFDYPNCTSNHLCDPSISILLNLWNSMWFVLLMQFSPLTVLSNSLHPIN